jgi:hypothetical protein
MSRKRTGFAILLAAAAMLAGGCGNRTGVENAGAHAAGAVSQDVPVVAERLAARVAYGSSRLAPPPASAKPRMTANSALAAFAATKLYPGAAAAATSRQVMFAEYTNTELPPPVDARVSPKSVTAEVWVVVFHGYPDVRAGAPRKQAPPEIHDIVAIVADLTGQVLVVQSLPGPTRTG